SAPSGVSSSFATATGPIDGRAPSSLLGDVHDIPDEGITWRDLFIKSFRFLIPLMRVPIHARPALLFRNIDQRIDKRSADALSLRVFRDKKILEVTHGFIDPGAGVQDVICDANQTFRSFACGAFGNESVYLIRRIHNPLPQEVGYVRRNRIGIGLPKASPACL